MDLKIKDVADLLGVSESTIRRMVSEGIIPAYKIDHQYRFSRIEIQDWVVRQKHSNGPEGKVSGRKNFSLYRAINHGGMLQNLACKNKEEAIRTTTKLVSKNLHLDAEGIAELLLDREKLQSTALNGGIALPHTRDFLLPGKQDAVVVVFPENPIDFDSLDGKPVHVLFFLFAGSDKMHLHLLAKIAHLCSLPQARDLLQSKPEKEVLMQFIKDWESSLA